ncbi:MAG: translocation/assembly module TamB domain-containing protein, partial [Thauera sp.]|nr:translocation/assembly module TamB domain-containing protein [Thauera sp.]
RPDRVTSRRGSAPGNRIDNRRPAAIDAGGLPLRSVTGVLAWHSGEVAIEALDLRIAGTPDASPEGRIAGRLAWTLPASASAGRGAQENGQTERQGGAGSASAFGSLVGALALADIDTRALDTRLPSQRVAGQLSFTADASRQQGRVALAVGKARIDASAELMAAATGESQASGEEPATLPAGTPARRFRLDGKLRGVDPRALAADAPSALLNLDLEASGTLAARTELQARFGLPDSRFGDRPLAGSGVFHFAGDAEAFRLSDVVLALDLAGNRLRAKGAWGGQGDRLALKLDAPALAAIGHGLGGRAGAEGTIGGSFASPSGTLTFFGEALRLPGELRLSGVNGEARLDAGMAGPFRLSVGLSGLAFAAARPASGASSPGGSEQLIDSAFMSAEGTRAAHVLRLQVSGVQDHTLALRLQGGMEALRTADKPGASAPASLNWTGQLTELASAGRFAARLVAPAALELGPERISLGAAELVTGAQGRIRLQETRWTPAASVVRGSLTGLVVDLRSRDATRAATPRGDRPRRTGPLTLGAEWNLRAGDTLDGEARVFRESGDLSLEGEIRTRLGLEALEARLAARGDRLALSLEASGSEMGRVEGSATVRAERVGSLGWRIAPQAAVLGSARLDMPSITWLGRLMRENIETGGRLNGEFALAGTVAEPLASGRISGRALQFALVDQGLVLSGGELDMSFDRDRLRLDRLDFVSPNRVRPRDSRVPVERLTAAPGTLKASGEIRLATGAGDFRFEAERLPLLQRPERWLIVSGTGRGRSTWTSLDLLADFRADAGYLEFAETPAPSLGDDVVVLGREQIPGSFGVTADLRVALGDALYLSAMGLDTRLTGELRLRQQPGLPLSAVGTVATAGGSYRGYGQRLSVVRGLVNFQGPLDNPGLNVVALRTGLEVEAGVEILGSARRPMVRLVSEPLVPDPEKLSWIVLGRAPDAASGADLGLLLPAAQALLGGPGGGMTDQLSRSLGFDSLSIGQGELNSTSRRATSRVVGGGSVIAGGPTVSGQVLSLGKRLGTDLFLSFEQSLGGAETLVKLTYQLSRRLSLIARGGTDNALDLHYSFSFR